MTSQSGGGSGYPGVTSDGFNGLIIQETLRAGNPSAASQADFHDIFGSLIAIDTDGNNVDGDSPLVVTQGHVVPIGGFGASAITVDRQGNIAAQDYSQAEISINDTTASAQPLLRLTKQGTVVLEVSTRRSITGALSTVTDAAAKAVLTSIIAALTDIKVATDNTT